MHPESLLVAWLTPRYPDARVVTERPEAMPAQLIQVIGIGGQTDRFRVGDQRCDIDVFAATRIDARDLATAIERDLLENLPGQTVNGIAVQQVASFMSPTWTADDNTNIRRFTLGVGLRLHDRSAA